MVEESDESKERQAYRERGTEQGRGEWIAAGVVTGQASCQGISLTPCTEKSRDEKTRGEERPKGMFRGEGVKVSWQREKQDDKTEEE